MKAHISKCKTALFIVVVFCLTYSCGYHLAGVKNGKSDRIQAVAVSLFSNETSEPNIEFMFTKALRDEFLKRGRIKLTSEEKADAIFRGRVIRIYTTDVAHTGVEQTSETRIFVTVDVKCEDKKSGRIIWQDNQLTFYEEYERGLEASEGYNKRVIALKYLAQQVAERIYDRFTNRF